MSINKTFIQIFIQLFCISIVISFILYLFNIYLPANSAFYNEEEAVIV